MDGSSRGRRFRIALFVALAALLAAVIAAGSLGLATGFFRRMPSDSELRTRFSGQEAGFTKLIDMSNEDVRVTLIRSNFTYLATDASWPRKDIGFSQERWNQYRGLFRELNVGGVTRRTDYPSSVFIEVYGSGGVLGSIAKGYAYSREPLAPLVQSLDVMPKDLYKKNSGHAIVFAPLAPDWYMFREEF